VAHQLAVFFREIIFGQMHAHDALSLPTVAILDQQKPLVLPLIIKKFRAVDLCISRAFYFLQPENAIGIRLSI